MAYAIIHKKTKLYFRCADDYGTEWTSDPREAKSYADPRDAYGQALLLRCNRHDVQQKPVVLPC